MGKMHGLNVWEGVKHPNGGTIQWYRHENSRGEKGRKVEWNPSPTEGVEPKPDWESMPKPLRGGEYGKKHLLTCLDAI